MLCNWRVHKVFTSYFNCYSFPSGSLGLKRDRKVKTKESPLKRRGERHQFQSSNLTERHPQLRSSLSESNFLPNLLLLDTDLLSSWRGKNPSHVGENGTNISPTVSLPCLPWHMVYGRHRGHRVAWAWGAQKHLPTLAWTGLPSVTSATWSVWAMVSAMYWIPGC